MRKGRFARISKTIMRYILMIAALIFFMFPIYWLLITSLKLPGEVVSNPVIWFPTTITFDNFRLLFGYSGPVW